MKEKVEKEEEEEEVEEEVRPILVQSTKGISYFSSLHSVVYFQNANIDRELMKKDMDAHCFEKSYREWFLHFWHSHF